MPQPNPERPLPPRVIREVERILDQVARGFFEERLELIEKQRKHGLTPEEVERLKFLETRVQK